MCRCVKYLLSTTDKHSCFSLTAEHSTSVMARSKELTVEKHCSMITLKIWEKYQLFDQIAAGVQIVVLILQEQYLWRRSSRELEATPAFFLILSFLFHTLTTRIEISLTPGIKTTDLYQKRHRLPNTWHGSTFTQRKFVRPTFVTEYRWKKFKLTRLITIGITL